MVRYRKDPVGAGYGLGDWLLQRVTAVVMALYTPFVAGWFLYMRPSSHAQWKAMFASSFVRLATVLFVAALLYHAWVGVRDIIMDYIKPAGLRLVGLASVGFALFAYLAWAIAILWGR